jgi:hypothetical protein
MHLDTNLHCNQSNPIETDTTSLNPLEIEIDKHSDIVNIKQGVVGKA